MRIIVLRTASSEVYVRNAYEPSERYCRSAQALVSLSRGVRFSVDSPGRSAERDHRKDIECLTSSSKTPSRSRCCAIT